MGGESPNVILYDVNGQEMSVSNGSAIPAGTSALMIAGSDGTNSRFITLDTSGRPVTVGAGVAGTPAGGVVTIQGVSGGTVVPISITGTNTVTANQGTSPWVTNITQFGGSNVVTGTGAGGSGIPRVTVSNDSNILATQSGTWTVQPGNTANTTPWLFTINQGGNSATVTASNALKVDGSAVTQPVSGTVTANQGTSPWITNITQFGGTNVATGTGTSGPGIPRVTVSNDSNVLVTQSTSPWVDNITQFGGTNISTGTGAGGSGIPRVTISNDSNILATQSGTWTVAQGAPNTLTNKWPVQVTDGTHTMPTMDAIARAGFQEITDGTNGPVAVKAASAVPVATDPALVVTTSPNSPNVNDTIGSTGTLNALNATATVVLASQSSIGMQLAAGTLVGTIVPEISVDGGTTWVSTFFDDPTTNNKVSSIVFGSSNTATTRTIVAVGGASNARVRVSAFTSGTASCTLRATDISNPSVLYTGPFSSTTQPPAVAQIAGWDVATTTLRVPAVKASSTAAAATDQALVVTLNPDSAPLQVTTVPTSATTGVVFGTVTYGGTKGLQTAIRATAYTEQTTNFTGSVKSSSTSDTSAGTGARTVTITYYDQTGSGPLTETVTLNGTTAVNLVNTNHCFIEKMVVATVGANLSNVGTISLFTGTGGTGTTVGTIGLGSIISSPTNTGDNQTYWTHHYTPAGKTSTLYEINVGTIGAQNATIYLRAAFPLTANATELQISDFLVAGANADSVSRNLSSPIKVSGFARITAYVVSVGANTQYFAGFDYSDA